MRIAISGKGGSGKTTIAGTLARVLRRDGVAEVLAIDADSNPNLALTLGVTREEAAALAPLPGSVIERVPTEDGKTKTKLAKTPADIVAAHGVATPDGVTLLLMGKVEHAGVGCMCGAHAIARTLVGELMQDERRPTVVDIEAGLEHLSRGTARHVDALVLVVEPYFKSMETAARMGDLARELKIPRVVAVANKVRGESDAEEIRRFLSARGIELCAAVPHDEAVIEAERRGVGPLDVAATSPAIEGVRALSRALLEQRA